MWKKKLNLKEEQYVRSSFFRVLSFLLFGLLSFQSLGVHFFEFTPNLIVAQRYNLELRLSTAADILQRESLYSSENSAVLYLLHSNSYLKAFVSEEFSDYKVYQEVREAAISHFELLNDTVPHKRFLLSELYFYSATLKAKHNELYGAARDLNKAHSLIESNHELFPDFLPNNKTRGILQVYLSTVPDNYGWVIRMLGIRGDLKGGMVLLKQLSAHRSDTGFIGGLAKETHYLYAFSLMHVANQRITAWSEMLKATVDYRTNLASCFFRSNLALKLNKNESAINTLQNRPSDSEYVQFYLLEHLLGKAKLNKQDSTAIGHLAKFNDNFKGLNYLKSNLQRMSWYYLVMGNHTKAKQYKVAILNSGHSINEEDKQAQRFGKKQLPNSDLLSTRLYYDGGYFDLASSAISVINAKILTTLDLKAEYCYRKGCILEKQGAMVRALKFYEACTLFAISSDEYYGAYAAIFLGDYYFKINDKVNSHKFYKRALSFQKNKEYTESIEQRAKTGLKKCSF
jgi:hypothetical protein